MAMEGHKNWNYRSSRLQIFFKIDVLKNFAIFIGKYLLNVGQIVGLQQLYLKVTPTNVFSCEYCEIFKNSFFYRTPLVAASGIIKSLLMQ